MSIFIDQIFNVVSCPFVVVVSSIRVEFVDSCSFSFAIVVSSTDWKWKNLLLSYLELVRSKLSGNAHGWRTTSTALHRFHSPLHTSLSGVLYRFHFYKGSILRNFLHFFYENEQFSLTNRELVELFEEDLATHFDRASDEIDELVSILSVPLPLKQICRIRIRKHLSSAPSPLLEHDAFSSFFSHLVSSVNWKINRPPTETNFHLSLCLNKVHLYVYFPTSFFSKDFRWFFSLDEF